MLFTERISHDAGSEAGALDMAEAQQTYVIVGFCEPCRLVDDPYHPYAPCDGDDEKDTPYYHHRYRKRRMWKCRGCDDYFLSKSALLAHNVHNEG